MKNDNEIWNNRSSTSSIATNPDSPDSAINLTPLVVHKSNPTNQLRRNSISLPALTKLDLEALQNLDGITSIDVSLHFCFRNGNQISNKNERISFTKWCAVWALMQIFAPVHASSLSLTLSSISFCNRNRYLPVFIQHIFLKFSHSRQSNIISM